MNVNYNKLWKLLIDKGMNKTELQLATLECNIGDIIDFIPSKDDKQTIQAAEKE